MEASIGYATTANTGNASNAVSDPRMLMKEAKSEILPYDVYVTRVAGQSAQEKDARHHDLENGTSL